MIKTIIEKIPAQKAKEIEKTVKICDVCKQQRQFLGKCVVCDRDVCLSCSKYDPYELGDYPDRHCPICYNLKYIRYKATLSNIEKQYSDGLESFDAMVKEESLKKENGLAK